MFNQVDVKLMSACINNYIELADSQINALTVGFPDCANLIEQYENQITNCYILQNKVNSLMLETLKEK